MVEFYIDGYKTVDYRFIENKEKAWNNVNDVGIDKFYQTMPFDDALISIKERNGKSIIRETFVSKVPHLFNEDNNFHIECHVNYIGKYQAKFDIKIPLEDEDIQYVPIPQNHWNEVVTPIVTNTPIIGIKSEKQWFESKQEETMFVGMVANAIAEIYMVWESCLNNKAYSTKRYREMRVIPRGEDKTDYEPIRLKGGITAVIRNDKPIDAVATRQYTRHLDAWFCRGHERHYKNGKVVWVKPCVKGQGKIKDTRYVVS